MKTLNIKTLMSVATIVLCLSAEAAAQTGGNWPQWRGPNRDGISKETDCSSNGRLKVRRWFGKRPAPDEATPHSQFPMGDCLPWASAAIANM